MWVERWRAVAGDEADFASSQEVSWRLPQIAQEEFERAVVYVEPGGRWWSGAEAVFRLLACCGRLRALPLKLYEKIPPFRTAADFFYRQVSKNRGFFSALTRLLWGNDVRPPTFAVASWLFLRWMGIIYVIAFLSLFVQVHGLIGEGGILPLTGFLEAASGHLGRTEAMRQLPMVFWLTGGGDAALSAVCLIGAAAGVAVIFGVLQAPALVMAWVCYFSLVQAGQIFLRYQWDALLLETGFLAILLAPWRVWGLRRFVNPPTAVRLLLWWLLFRLMFCSGVVKLSSGDEAWRNLTALSYHYLTQPIPTPLAWVADKWPDWVQKWSCGAMFGIELVLPFLLFLPRHPRLLAGIGFMALQVVIIATGNYGFFNLLTIGLCFFAFDDALVPSRFRRVMRESVPTPPRWSRWILWPVAVVIFLAGVHPFLMSFRQPGWLFPPSAWLCEKIRPWMIVNGYGLFAVMTKERCEILVEGSEDGVHWKPYVFRWKPGDVHRAPPWVQPHMPRLDWQMWFAALAPLEQSPWFLRFVQCLLEGREEVLALLEENPFPNRPPRYVRAKLDRYRFSTVKERQEENVWWVAEPVGQYCPEVSLRP